ncbi:MAG: anaerobic ribonucleoside triphosphate reductase [Puniceicoccales bacterium]|jgi:ribonucleoside-triphosphate reductase|nr:anaerobic ribonucleoside triphosphate reductase [Puniceicoccales bacterium]
MSAIQSLIPGGAPPSLSSIQSTPSFHASARSAPTVSYIRKRDGRTEIFYLEKVIHAIQAAVFASGLHDHTLADAAGRRASLKLAQEFRGETPTVEQIQDTVERTLVEMNRFEVAKSYILYRRERSRVRDSKSRLFKTISSLVHDDAEKNDLKRDNANVDGNTAMGMMLKFGSECSKEFSRTSLLNPAHTAAHDNGDIHIHDLDFLPMGTLTCCQIDIAELFAFGFGTGHGSIRAPRSIASFAALAAIVLQSNQNEQHGGQGIPNFDYAMARGVELSFRTAFVQNLAKFIKFEGSLVGKDAVENAVATWESAADHHRVTYPRPALPEVVQSLARALSALSPKISEDALNTVFEVAAADTERATRQAMEGFIHNLNTMHSRAGAQVPFTSINFGTDTGAGGRLVSFAILEAVWNGLGAGETPIFPITIFKVKDGVNYSPGDPNYDLFKEAMRVSSKRLFPNFVFIDAPFNLQYYKAGDYRTEVATMGCRTRTFSSIFPESDGRITSRGNLSFTTINLPAIAIKHGIALRERGTADMAGFYRELDEKINLVADQLRERFEIQAAKTPRNFPFLMGQGIWMGSKDLKPDAPLRDIIKHGSLSIGFIGLAESLVALVGEHHGTGAKARVLGFKIISRLRKRADELASRHQLNFTLLATPAEGIAGRFTGIDRERFGVIEGVTDREYYTNSFHVPVYQKISAFDKIEIEAPYHSLCNAGHITYIEMDGSPLENPDAFETVIRKMKESGIGYGSVNHPVDRDPVCGYTGIIHDVCPRCGRSENDGGPKFERIRRITGYLVGTMDRWNNAKRHEEKDRVKHGYEGGG